MHGLMLDLAPRSPHETANGSTTPRPVVPLLDTRLLLAASAFEHSTAAVMITDTRQRILAVNRAFTTITGYSEQQAIDQTPRLLASGQHDSAFFTALWHRLDADGHWQGEILNRRCNGETYPSWLTIDRIRDTHGQTSHYIGVFADISALKQQHASLDHQAHHDPLTGLPNRTLFEHRLHKALEHSQESGSLGAVLFLDLDRFKPVNDSLGHATGDQLLKGVAQRLKDQLRDIDTVARFGGDEFVILLPGLLQPGDAQTIAHKLLASFSAPLLAGEHELSIGLSIGTSLFPTDGMDPTSLIRNADAAMYRAKARGRHCVEPYTHDLSVRRRERASLQQQLLGAIERNELQLDYQPRIALPHGQPCGVEALLRWNHPQLGQLPAERFMPLAEENGSAPAIADWLLDTACRQLQQWQRRCPGFGPLCISLSSAQLRQPQLLERIVQRLSSHRLAPHSLQLEISEPSLMTQPEHTLGVLHNLKRLGLRLAIDDFGSGHASLGYLKRLPLDSLKIGSAFTRGLPDDPHDLAVVRAIIALGRSLGLSVIATGISLPEQRQLLADEGCQHLQGPTISPPLSARAFSEKYLPAALSDFSDGTAGEPPV